MKNNRTTYFFFVAILGLTLSYFIATPVYSQSEPQSAKIIADELPGNWPVSQLLFLQSSQGKAAINTSNQLPGSGFEHIQDEARTLASYKEADNKRLAVYLINFSKTRFNSQRVSRLIFPFHSYL